MTTKFQQRTIHLLTNRPAPHNHYSPSSSSIQHHHQLELEFSMDRVQDFKNIESMRKMMLIQEEIFKHQVQELHRLYKLQKYLMQDLENGLMRRQKAKTTHSGDNNNTASRTLPIKLGLTMPPGNPITDQKDLKRIDEENTVEVELTLSIGHCTGKKRPMNDPDHRDQEQQLGSSSGKTGKGDESPGAYPETTRPYWLLQDLSLNRT